MSNGFEQDLLALVDAAPVIVALVVSAYVSALVVRSSGGYLDGGRLGWISLGLWALGFLIYMGVFLGMFWLFGVLPDGRLR